jgi:sortase A
MKKKFVDGHRCEKKVKIGYLVGLLFICLGILCFLIPMASKTAGRRQEESLIGDFFNETDDLTSNSIDNQATVVRYIDASSGAQNITITDDNSVASADSGSVNPTSSVSSENYSKYNMVVEVPSVGIKKGIYPMSSPYNNIKYNVQLMQTSTTPDCKNGNVILAAHNGNSTVSYFDNLKNAKNGDTVNLYYRGIQYAYRLVNIYEVLKNGTVEIKRDTTKSCVTLITCKSKDKTKQVVYIGELESAKQY